MHTDAFRAVRKANAVGTFRDGEDGKLWWKKKGPAVAKGRASMQGSWTGAGEQSQGERGFGLWQKTRGWVCVRVCCGMHQGGPKEE
ncbi:MAG: hypothetical protein Q9159_000019 [Coniocarpon cinnabarinum]